jgi:hypothetical protein
MSIAVGDKATGTLQLFLADGTFFTADCQLSVIGAGERTAEEAKQAAESAKAAEAARAEAAKAEAVKAKAAEAEAAKAAAAHPAAHPAQTPPR